MTRLPAPRAIAGAPYLVAGVQCPVAGPLAHPLASSQPPHPRSSPLLAGGLATQTLSLLQQVHSP